MPGAQNRRWTVASSLLLGLWWLLLAMAWMLCGDAAVCSWHGPLFMVFLVVAVIAVPVFGRYVQERYRNLQLVAPTAEEVLQQDARPPVVYLRSFADETKILRRYRRHWPTEEELLAKVFSEFGPFLAIGKPSDGLPIVGAARMYVSETCWRPTVRDLVDGATFVALRLGDSPGVLEELDLVMRRLPPRRVLLLSALRREAHATASVILETRFGVRLPQFSSLPSVVTFEDDWAARRTVVRHWLLRGSPRATDLEVGLRAALVDFLRRLGRTAEIPPLALRRVAGAVFFLGVIGVLGLGSAELAVYFLQDLHRGSHATPAMIAFVSFLCIASLTLLGMFVALARQLWLEARSPDRLIGAS